MTRASERRELIGCLNVDPDQPGVCGLRSPAPSLWGSLSYREASWIVHPVRDGEDAPLRSAELSSVRLHVDVVHQTPDDEMKSVELIITMCTTSSADHCRLQVTAASMQMSAFRGSARRSKIRARHGY